MLKVMKQVVCEPLESPELISLLSTFYNLFQSSIGPSGKLKIIITAGSNSTLTSQSTRIVNNIVIDHPVCIFISQVMKSHLTDFKDCGHYLGVLISRLLFQILSQDILPSNVANLFIQQMTPDLITIANSIKIHIDFNTVKQLLPIVKTILTSKPACCLSKMEIDGLTVIIIKAFINSIQDDDVGLGNINVVCGECCGDDKPALVPGCLYQTTEDLCPLYNGCHKKLLIVFDTMLSNEKPIALNEHDRVTADFERSDSFQVHKALKVLEQAVELGVNIVACQKVVHPLLSLFLRRNNIILLDRMGTQVTRQVVSISGAVPISDYTRYNDKEHLKPFLGHVNSIQQVSWGGKTYIALEREDKNVSTLLVSATNPEAAEELKITIDQALCALRRLLSEPFLTPGAGCTEMILAASLHVMVLQKQNRDKYPQPLAQRQAYVRWLQISLLSAVGLCNPSLNLAVDSVYYHAWSFDDDNRSACRCGLVNAEMVNCENGSWRELDMTTTVIFGNFSDPKYITTSRITENVIVDLYGTKYNALKLSLESCTGLLGIGMIVHKTTA